MLYLFYRLCRPVRSPANHSAATRKKRGFNLIEATIVLGVVGLVIGGIWVAAASVMQKQRVQQTVDGFFVIAERLDAAYHNLPISSWQGISSQNVQDIIGILPDGWSVSGNFINSPIFLGLRVTIHDQLVEIDNSSVEEASSESDCVAFGVMFLQRFNTVENIESVHIWGAGDPEVIAERNNGVPEWRLVNGGQSGVGLPDPLLAAKVGSDCHAVQIYFSR